MYIEITKADIDTWQELDGVWFAQYSFDTGSIGANAKTKDEAVRDVLSQWRHMALPNGGRFAY